MKLCRHRWQGAAVMLAVLGAPGYFATPVQGATDNPAQGASGIYAMTFHLDSQLIAMKCSGRAIGGYGGPTYVWRPPAPPRPIPRLRP